MDGVVVPLRLFVGGRLEFWLMVLHTAAAQFVGHHICSDGHASFVRRWHYASTLKI